MPKIKRVVFYAVNGAGMGHITRLLSVARWTRRYLSVLEERVPEILFLTSSEATGVLLDAGFASFKIPSKTVVRQAAMDMAEYRRLARHFVWQTLGMFSPDLFVVDTFPAGSFDELLQVLDGPFRKAFILRHVREEFARRPIYRAALGLYGAVAIPHGPEVFGEGGPALPHPERATYCGEVLQFDRDEVFEPEAARARLGVPGGRRLIYVSAGGGGDPGSEEALHGIASALLAMDDVHVLVGAGPLYQGRRLGGERITWYAQPGIYRFLAACDGAISAGGYNTFHELLYLRVPSLFFAQAKVADDQARRIRRAAEAGACLHLSDVTDGEAVRRGVRRLLAPEVAEAMKVAAASVLPENGAARCAQALLSSVYDEGELAWASGVVSPEVAGAFEALGGPGLALMARWLPRLVPQARWGGLVERPSFRALLDQLDPAVVAAVEAAAAASPEAEAVEAVRRELVALLTLAGRWPTGPEGLTSLVDVVVKKFPLHQETSGQWLRWMGRLLARLHATLSIDVTGWEPEDVARACRIFPRVVDADLEASADLLDAFLRACDRVGVGPDVATRRLRALKFAHRRITAETFGAFLKEMG